uniref:Uncharacterized protein n=1 Tax=Meloidogyne incognita TaxID=6306 RepID=A0A914L097_MELIC
MPSRPGGPTSPNFPATHQEFLDFQDNQPFHLHPFGQVVQVVHQFLVPQSHQEVQLVHEDKPYIQRSRVNYL